MRCVLRLSQTSACQCPRAMRAPLSPLLAHFTCAPQDDASSFGMTKSLSMNGAGWRMLCERHFTSKTSALHVRRGTDHLSFPGAPPSTMLQFQVPNGGERCYHTVLDRKNGARLGWRRKRSFLCAEMPTK
eukprot:6193854-Pleurochrysis_carterae.AAC.2